MKKIYLALALFSVFNFQFSIVNAQNDDGTYNESVVVRGSYRPVIDSSEKIFFPMEMTDTAAAMSHSFNYSIKPNRLHVFYEPASIKAARLSGEPVTRLYNNYFRVGMGNYWSPLLDLYWSSTRDPLKTYGVRFNHHSSWGSISSDNPGNNYGKNHFGLTGITLFGKYIVGDVLQLSSDINFEHDHNLYYGFNDNTLATVLPAVTRDNLELSDIHSKYNNLTWNLGIRNMELDAYKLGYSLDLRLSNLWASWNQNEFNLNLNGDIHYGFNIKNQYKGVAYLHAEWDGYIRSFSPDGTMPLGYIGPAATEEKHHLNIVKVNPYADFMFNGLLFHVGFTAGWDAFTEPSESTIFRFFPDVVVSKHLFDGSLVLSIGATGGIDANNLVISGSSAGAMITLSSVLETCSLTERTAILPEGYAFKGAMSFAGAIMSNSGVPSYGTPPPPQLLFHGTADGAVNYEKTAFGSRGFYGSSALVKDVFEKKGYTYCIYRYKDHSHDMAANMVATWPEQQLFLERNVVKGLARTIDAFVDDPAIPVMKSISVGVKDIYK